MKKKTLLIIMVAVCLINSPALGDTVVGHFGSWQSFTSSKLDKDGKPYFDQPSLDDGNRNVGYFLTGTGGVYFTDYLGTNPQFWGLPYNKANDSGGGADIGFHWTNASPSGIVTLLIEVAGYATTNIFGWFEWDSGVKHPIFPGSDGAPLAKTVAIGEAYGFYLERENGPTFYTDVNGDLWTNPDQTINFAVFRGDRYGPDVFFLGCEDLTEAELGKCREGWIGDFNDMVVKIQPLPLPGSLVLLGSGLVGLGLLGWRRRSGR
jgi:hypothetical protein